MSYVTDYKALKQNILTFIRQNIILKIVASRRNVHLFRRKKRFCSTLLVCTFVFCSWSIDSTFVWSVVIRWFGKCEMWEDDIGLK